MSTTTEQLIRDSISTAEQLLSGSHVAAIDAAAHAVINAYRLRRKVLVFGNGGSASDAQHLAAELVCRFEKNRPALPALALTTNTSSLTAIGNDFSFEDVFSRQVEALASPEDVAIGISTSGNSPNVLKAIEQAKALKAVTVGFTGGGGGKLKSLVDICFCAPSTVTARVQECHILAVHIISRLVEEALFGEKK